MATEYVKLEPSEHFYGKKHLLYSEMEILTIIKRYQKYKELRKKELSLKGMLRRAITELEEHVKILDSALPKIKLQHTEEEKFKVVESAKKRNDLETEILEIQQQISRLQS